MLQSPYQAYQKNSVQTATPGQLVIMLYDGAIKFTKAGMEGIRHKQYAVANQNLKKAQSIVHELIASLNQEVAISKDLLRIYEYMLYCLIEANIKKEPRHAEEVLNHLQDLREAWKQVIKQGHASASAGGLI